jgi:hypothetical protein
MPLLSIVLETHLLVSLDVNCQLLFFGHQLGQIVRETVGVVQTPGDVTRKDFGS